MKAIRMLLAAGLLVLGTGAGARAEPVGDDAPAAPAASSDQPENSAQPAASVPRVVSDAPVLRERIETALEKEPSLKNQRIDVSLRQCHLDDGPARCDVTLTGTVATQAERATAERVARIKGVVLIDNRLQLASEESRSNQEPR